MGFLLKFALYLSGDPNVPSVPFASLTSLILNVGGVSGRRGCGYPIDPTKRSRVHETRLIQI